MKITPILNRFTFGEISPLIFARGDLAKYPAAAKRLENFVPLVEGPLKKRGGTRFAAVSANGDRPVALLPFTFSETSAYVIEVGSGYMRFFHNGAPLKNGLFDYKISTDIAQDQIFLENGLLALKYVQSGDVMYIVAPGMEPKKLARFGHLDWRLVPLPGWGARPWPSAVALFRERLCLAAGRTVYMSQSGAFEEFQVRAEQKDASGNIIVPVAADDPIEINVYSEQMDRIEWLCPQGGLLAGTSGSEFTIGETTTVSPLGPKNIKVTSETAFGSSPLGALRVGGAILFVERAGRRLREFVCDYSGDSHRAVDLTAAAEHITRGGVTAMAWQAEPAQTLWAARPDGQLLGLTYSREEDMAAWHRHILGGDGKVSQLAVIPAAHGGRDELWLSVRREVMGRARFFIEVMTPAHDPGDDPAESLYLDCAITVSGARLEKVTGLQHLEGREVAVLADGRLLAGQVISRGSINLPAPAERVTAGFPYRALVSTADLAIETQRGSSAARLKRVTRATLKLIESGGGAAGPDPGHLEKLDYNGGAFGPLFTGDKKISWPGGYETEGSLTVAGDEPLPFILAAIIPEMILE